MPRTAGRALALAAFLLLALWRSGLALAGPVHIEDVSSSESGGRLDIRARCSTSDVELSVRYRVNLGDDEKSAPMMVVKSKREWSASLQPGADAPPGALIRFRVVATRHGEEVGSASGPPSVLAAYELASVSHVPTLYAYTSNLEKARGDYPTPVMVWFDARDGNGGKFYGNVTTHRTGSERHDGLANQWGKGKSKDWPKTNFKLSFHGKGEEADFFWSPGLPSVHEVELHSLYQESGPTSYSAFDAPFGSHRLSRPF
jgi:hypothetical protein